MQFTLEFRHSQLTLGVFSDKLTGGICFVSELLVKAVLPLRTLRNRLDYKATKGPLSAFCSLRSVNQEGHELLPLWLIREDSKHPFSTLKGGSD